MLKWTLGHKLPTPGPLGAPEPPTLPENAAENQLLHFARRRRSAGAVRKASTRSLRRQNDEDKENQPPPPPHPELVLRDSGKKTPLKDLSNSPIAYQQTPRRRLRRRQSHPLRLTHDVIPVKDQPVDFVVPTGPTIRRNSEGTGDVVDTRHSTSTIKATATMQIEYSPGPLTATQSLMSLRRRLTKSLAVPDTINPLHYARAPHGNGATLASESSPSFESMLEEKSILSQCKAGFLSSLRQNSKSENCLMSSLSERLEWLRLNNSFGHSSVLNSSGGLNQGRNANMFPNTLYSRRRMKSEEDDNMRLAKKMKNCDSVNGNEVTTRCSRPAKTEASFCDKLRTKTDSQNTLMGLTLPMGIPSPIGSEDSGLCLGLEGIHPLNLSPIRAPLTEEAVSSLTVETINSASSSLLVNKCSPLSSTASFHFNKLSSSSLGSSLRKRLNDEEMELNGSAEEMVAMKTPRLDAEDEASPLAMVEKRSRSRRCLRFVSPGCSQRRRTSSAQTLSSARLKDFRPNLGELELRVYSQCNMLTIHIGRGSELHRPGGRLCNAYAKVALVPSNERTFYRTPVQREASSPNFDEKFSFELQPEDLNKRILVSVWHRDRENRRSEFLGCVSLAVKNAVKKEISGSFRLAAQSTGGGAAGCSKSINRQAIMMARRSECSSVEETITVDSEEAPDDSTFLRHLELEAAEDGRPGKTLFTTTKHLVKTPGAGFGLSIAWTHPPRVERVEAGQAAERAGIWVGDSVIFVGKTNIVTKSEEEVLQLIKSCGDELTLEVFRRSVPNGLVEPAPQTSVSSRSAASAVPTARSALHSYHSPRSAMTASSGATSSVDLSKRRLHLPHVAFSTETYSCLYDHSAAICARVTRRHVINNRLRAKTGYLHCTISSAVSSNVEEPHKRVVYQLLSKEQSYTAHLQFGVNRFLLPLAERKDLINATQHHVLFQNMEEDNCPRTQLLRLSEDIIEQASQEDIDSPASFLGRIYVKRVLLLTTAYRKYCSGIKRADCMLAETSKSLEFTQFCTEPPIPKRKPDLTAFLHKPLEHYRDLLNLTTTVLNQSKSSEEDHYTLARVVHELDVSYREWTSGAGIMEPSEEGRPLLSVQDLESRLVFTRCKPFVLSAPGRHWLFGGDLSRVEGRAVRPFWALLFSDMIVFAKVSRDRVLFVMEEPLSLLSVSQAFFNVRKKANEFRLLLNTSPTGTDSPANAICGPDLGLNRTPKKNAKCRSIVLRAPSPELKAVWQNLIQRQIIHLNATRGGTPASSPLESPDPPTTLSVATLDSLSLRRQVADQKTERFAPKEIEIIKGTTKQLNELIDHKCRQLGKTKTTKGGAIHLAEWMKGQLGNNQPNEPDVPDKPPLEPEPEIWSQEELKRRTSQLQVSGCLSNRNESRCEEIDMASERSASRMTELSQQSFSTSESITTIRSNHADKAVPVCRQCRDTCLKAEAFDDDDYDDTWGSLLCGRQCKDPFQPAPLPAISVLPPTPDKQTRCTAFEGPPRSPSVLAERHCSSAPCSPVSTIIRPHSRISEIIEGDEDDDTPEGSQQSSELDQPYRTLSSSLRRFGTLASLDQVGSDGRMDEDFSEDEDDVTETEEKDLKPQTPPSRSPAKGPKKGEQCAPIRSAKTYPEVIQPVRSWVAPAEVATPVRGWTARAGSFVAEKMALFERLSAADNATTVRKTTFLERYLKPSSECHLDSPPDQGTNTSSSGRGDDEGSGATSGEEAWGTPTSGGEYEEELIGESSALSFMDSPHGSVCDDDDDTEQLMEDLLISLPMLAARAPGVPPRRRLEPLPEEEDTDGSSAPCSPKPLHEVATEQGRVSSKFQAQHHDNCPNFGTNSSIRPLSSRREAPPRPRIGTIDRALGISEEDDEEIQVDKMASSPSILHRLGLKRNRVEGSKTSRFGQIIQGQMQKMAIQAIPLPKLPSAKAFSLPAPLSKYNVNKIVSAVAKKARKRDVADLPHIEVIQWGNERFGSEWSARIKKNVLDKMPKLSTNSPTKPVRRMGGIRRRTPSPTYSHDSGF